VRQPFRNPAPLAHLNWKMAAERWSYDAQIYTNDASMLGQELGRDARIVRDLAAKILAGFLLTDTDRFSASNETLSYITQTARDRHLPRLALLLPVMTARRRVCFHVA
jgi:hypothetical protein